MEASNLLDSESDSIDVSSIKFAVLHDQESIQDQPGSDRSLIAQQQLAAIRNALNKLSPIKPPAISTAPTTNTAPELASTVHESESLPNVESPVEFLGPAITHDRQATPGQKMTSQSSDAPTQELSQSHYTTLLQSRSRSAAQLLREQQDEDDEESPQFSLREGDEGHIDLLSSLMSPKDGPSELDSEPVEFSPTQSQRALSQFPESQRFKTPATAGKKRSYDGDIIDSPVLPRNPLLGNGSHKQEHIMGLSQAFAATQADTSPFVHDGNGDILSDRPSPNIELRPRPVTATSSPMRPISAFKRASTEPASRYISVREELALREQGEPEPREASDDEDDVFAHLQEPHSMTKYRRRLAIDKQVKVSLQRLSSPSTRSLRRPSLSKSSPIRQNHRSSLVEPLSSRIPKLTDRSSPTRADSPCPLQESEEETDLEDSPQIAVARSSQVMVALNDCDDDKENYLGNGSQVPETAARLIRVANGDPSEIEDSPSLRHYRRVSAEKHAIQSSQPFAVADSQSSQSRRRLHNLSQALKSTPAAGSVDFVPQSPSAGVEFTEAREKERTAANVVPNGPSEDLPSAMPENAASNTPVHQNGTIPETSSNEPPPEPSGAVTSNKHNDSDSANREEFETAQSQVPRSTEPSKQQGHNGDGGSGLPDRNSTPSRKRRRMTEIAADPSPLKSQPSFNVTDALHLDPAFQSTPKRPPLENPSSSKHSSTAHIQAVELDNREHAVEESENSPGHGHPANKDDEVNVRRTQHLHASSPELASTPRQTTGHSSRRLRKPTVKALEIAKSHTPAADPQSRRSQWDLDASPPRKAPLARPNSSLKRKRREVQSTADAQEISLKRQKVADKTATTTTRPVSPNAIPDDTLAPPLENVGAEMNTDVERSPETIWIPNVVFACFNGKSRAYYPAICLGLSDADPKRYLVQWEGYDPEEIDQHGVRSLDLHVGDQIKVNLQGFPKVPYIIKGFKDKISASAAKRDYQILSDVQGYKTLLVSTKQRKSLPADVSTEALKEVPVSSIYLDSNMWGQMKDRLYEHKAAAPGAITSGISTPAHCSSTPCSPPSRNRRGLTALPTALSLSTCVLDGLFTNMAFAISYDDETHRDRLERQIRRQGGSVLKESFLDLLELDSLRVKRQHADLSFTALLTDRHSRKEKYMQALALGVPCLSGRWIEACMQAEELVSWSTYLLPSGECAELDGATRSRVLSFDPASNLKVHDMIESRARILNGARVVVAMKSGGEKVEKRRKAFVFLIRALGAGEIVGVSDLASAKGEVCRPEDSSDGEDAFVFVDDRDIVGAKALFEKGDAVPTSRKGRKRTRTLALSKANKAGPGSDGGRGGVGPSDQEDNNDDNNTKTMSSNVKVICNEDIVQSLILGRLWIG